MDKIFAPFLPPWAETGLQPAFYDVESGTVLQQTARMYAKVQQLTRLFNELSEETQSTVNEYIDKFTELYNYVHDYFDNLDVQDEINNKLDAMIEDGTMQEIVERIIGLGALVTFETVDDMINAEPETLSVGDKVQTLGKDTLGDGFGAYYIIGETGDIELNNGLFATLVPDFGGNNYYDEITFTKERHYDTDCYFTIIPYQDKDNKEIPLYIGQASDESEGPEKYAQKNFTTFTANATLNIGGAIGVGSLIKDGEIARDIDTSTLQSGYRYIGIRGDREIVDFVANSTDAQTMLDAGCEMAWLVYFRLVQSGSMVDLSQIQVGGNNIVYGRHPRQCLGQKANGDIVILTCNGRTVNDTGLTAEECATLLINKGCSNAWNLDGGGSSSTNIKGVKINRDIDGSHTEDRFIEYTLNVKKETIDKELAKAYSQIGEVKNNLSDDLMPLINFCLEHTQTIDISGTSLNDQTDELMFAMGNGLTDTPLSDVSTGYFINIPHFNPQYVGLYTKQIFFVRDRNQVFVRTMTNGSFSPWYDIKGNVADFSTLTQQTISATNTYEALVYNTSMLTGNADIFGLYQPDGSGNSDRIKVNTYGKVVFRTYLIIEPIGTRDVFIRYTLGNNPIDNTRTKVHVTASERICVPIEYAYGTCTPDNTFGVEYYGQSGDKVEFKTIVEL